MQIFMGVWKYEKGQPTGITGNSGITVKRIANVIKLVSKVGQTFKVIIEDE